MTSPLRDTLGSPAPQLTRAASIELPIGAEAKQGFIQVIESLNSKQKGRSADAGEQLPKPVLAADIAYSLVLLAIPSSSTEGPDDEHTRQTDVQTSDSASCETKKLDFQLMTPAALGAQASADAAFTQTSQARKSTFSYDEVASIVSKSQNSSVKSSPVADFKKADQTASPKEIFAARTHGAVALASGFAASGIHEIREGKEVRGEITSSQDRDVQVDQAPASPLLKIHASEIGTHFPVAIVNALVTSSSEGESQPVTQFHNRDASQETNPAPLKVLRFEIEPASLGTISVKIRVAHSRVEIKIDTESASTSAMLIDARETLSSAISERGLTLDAFEVTTPTPPTLLAAGGQDGSYSEGRHARHAGGQGFSNEERSGQNQRQYAPSGEKRMRETSTPASMPIGVIL